MKNLILYSSALLILCLSIVSCQKPDQVVGLPQKTGSQYDLVEMGEDYQDQIFYDLETHRTVFISRNQSWDLAFDASATGYHVFINGGSRNVFVYNTHETDINKVYTAPKIAAGKWGFDSECGLPDSTAIGEWQVNNISKNEVYIIKIDPTLFPDSFQKIQLIAVTPEKYVMAYGDLKSQTTNVITIPKNPDYNYVYFSFDKKEVVTVEPPKNTWDIVFTRYRHVYYELDNMAYPVNGVLTNPYNTIAAADSSLPYEKMTSSILPTLKFLQRRDVIGFEWKYYDRKPDEAISKYIVQRNKIFFIRTRNDQFYKLHFLDFYNSMGVKGSPSFEYERLQ